MLASQRYIAHARKRSVLFCTLTHSSGTHTHTHSYLVTLDKDKKQIGAENEPREAQRKKVDFLLSELLPPKAFIGKVRPTKPITNRTQNKSISLFRMREGCLLWVSCSWQSATTIQSKPHTRTHIHTLNAHTHMHAHAYMHTHTHTHTHTCIIFMLIKIFHTLHLLLS